MQHSQIDIEHYNLKCMPMTQHFPNILLIAWQRLKLKLQYHFFGRIFVAVFHVEILNFIGYANNTACHIALHNDFQKSFIYLKVVDLLNVNEADYSG